MRFPPRGSAQHATVVQFVKKTIGKEHKDLTALFDHMRRKRNRAVYETAKLVGEKETIETLSLAHDFVTLLRDLINQE
jgi:uncharacterized protein (UPF0332 family)